MWWQQQRTESRATEQRNNEARAQRALAVHDLAVIYKYADQIKDFYIDVACQDKRRRYPLLPVPEEFCMPREEARALSQLVASDVTAYVDWAEVVTTLQVFFARLDGEEGRFLEDRLSDAVEIRCMCGLLINYCRSGDWLPFSGWLQDRIKQDFESIVDNYPDVFKLADGVRLQMLQAG